jgi:hypothetical protein
VATPDEEKPEIPTPHPVTPKPWHHGYRWVFFLFVALVLALAFWVGWHVIRAWTGLFKEWEGF